MLQFARVSVKFQAPVTSHVKTKNLSIILLLFLQGSHSSVPKLKINLGGRMDSSANNGDRERTSSSSRHSSRHSHKHHRKHKKSKKSRHRDSDDDDDDVVELSDDSDEDYRG